MNTRLMTLLRLALLLIVVVPVAAWWAVRPVRVLAPSLVGLSCDRPVCVNDASQQATAEALYAEAMAFVAQTIAPLEGSPRVIFCAAQACADTFGLGARSAVTLGTWGTVIGPRAWKDYYVRHELIHHLQGQQLGIFRRLLMPRWFVEGMAYSLSQDPRSPLAEPWESDRLRFNKWTIGVAREQFWQEAGKL